MKLDKRHPPEPFRTFNLLKGSDTPGADQRRFLKAQILFWLMGATDGHAKNFSLGLAPGGRFSLAPLYDVLSTQPLHDAGQIARGRWKLSMAVGRNRHCGETSIRPRHYLQTAVMCGLPERMMAELFDELIATASTAMDRAVQQMPKPFPRKLIASIRKGFESRLEILRSDRRR